MNWFVELVDPPSNRRLLEEVLSKLSLTIVEKDPHCLISGYALDTMDSAEKVHSHLAHIESVVNEICAHESALDIGFRIGCVLEQMPDGNERRHYFLVIHDAVHAHTAEEVTLTVEPTYVTTDEERLNIQQVYQELQYQHLRQMALTKVVSALVDERALTVQRLLRSELTPQSLGHVADLIQDDLGASTAQFSSEKQWSRFYRSINHPTVFGTQARHIVSKVDPPPNPMTLEDATSFIRTIALRWLELKAGLQADD